MVTRTRTEQELASIALALAATRGAAPGWLAAELSAPEPAAFRRARVGALLSFAALAASLTFSLDLGASVRVERPKALAPAPVDPEAAAAIALTQGWRIAGEDRGALERLGGLKTLPDGSPAWRAESEGAGTWLVLFRDEGGTATAFEADLAAGAVTPTPEAVDRLTLLRVRDEADARLRLLASGDGPRLAVQ